jgi:hypothetical protein
MYVPDLSIAHSSKTIFHFIVTHSSIVHFISDFDNLFKKCALDDKISHGYHTSINSHSILNALKRYCFTNSLIASVISYSHLGDNFILFTISNILPGSLKPHRLAKFQIYSAGFSIISDMLFSLSTLYIQYFSGSGTSLTKTQYQSKVKTFSKSLSSKIPSQYMIITSSSDSIHLIAAHVPFSSLCSL